MLRREALAVVFQSVASIVRSEVVLVRKQSSTSKASSRVMKVIETAKRAKMSESRQNPALPSSHATHSKHIMSIKPREASAIKAIVTEAIQNGQAE